jgi:hypothetical protein
LRSLWPEFFNEISSQQKAKIASHFKVICLVQSLSQKYSAFVVGQINGFNLPVSPE